MNFESDSGLSWHTAPELSLLLRSEKRGRGGGITFMGPVCNLTIPILRSEGRGMVYF
jgi:hypothetical protein